MIIKRRSILFITALSLIVTALFSISEINAAETVKAQNPETILFLPFTDYSDSGMKYLSAYIPELLRKNFKSEKNIEAIDISGLTGRVKGDSLRPENLKDRPALLSLIRDAGGVMGVTGRYLIQGQTIIIETGLLKPDGEYIEGNTFEGKIDDRFFHTLDEYSKNSVKWIRGDILHENIPSNIVEQHDISLRFVKFLKEAGLSSMQKGWFFAVIIMMLFYVLSMFVSTVLIKAAERFSSRTDTKIDDLIINLAKKPLKFIIILAGFKVALFASDVHSGIVVFTGKLLTALILIALAYITSGILEIVIESWGERIAERLNSRVNNDLVPLFERIMKVVVFSVVLILVLSSFDIDVAPLVASLGIAGFAIGFAVKDTLSNIIGGIILILDNSFSVGDKVTIDSDTGIIKEVGLRNTKILTYDNELIIIPNGELMNKKFKNYVLPDPALRVVVNFGVAYGSDVDRVREIILEAVKSISDICSDPAPVIEFFQMADSSLNFVAKFWIPDFSKYNDKMLEATDIIYKTLNANGIEIPFPTNTVYLKKD